MLGQRSRSSSDVVPVTSDSAPVPVSFEPHSGPVLAIVVRHYCNMHAVFKDCCINLSLFDVVTFAPKCTASKNPCIIIIALCLVYLHL